MTSDRELLSRYLADGDEMAFTELVDRYLVLVRGIAWRASWISNSCSPVREGRTGG
ncbi:MAG: hypothetical protein KDN22_32655 [Verrucomicrobiae bacterium]|nr:hypothetical protein [Verrucomicrobiae bacterium]